MATTRVVSAGFRRRVYTKVHEVPAGAVTTYGDVATALGSPRVARHVGWALAALGDDAVPWHRVINAQGRISFKGDTERAALQRSLLEAEGVVFDTRDRVDLRLLRHRYTSSWIPNPEDALDLLVDDALVLVTNTVNTKRDYR